MYSSPHVYAVVRAADWTVRVSSALTTKLAHKLAYYVEAYSVRAHLPISGVSIHRIIPHYDLFRSAVHQNYIASDNELVGEYVYYK